MFVQVVLAITFISITCYFLGVKRTNRLPGKVLTERYLIFSSLIIPFDSLIHDMRHERYAALPLLSTGPSFRLPILGHLPFLGENPARTLLQWSKKYGPVFHVHLGSYRAIVINDSQLIKKAFNLNSFAGRPHNKLFDEITHSRRGLMFSDGPKSLEQRKFVRRFLKALGSGTSSMESRIINNVPALLEVFEDHLSKPLNVKHAFNHDILNVIWSIVAGESLNKNDTKIQQLAENISKIAKMSTILEKLSYFLNFVPDLFPELSGSNEKFRAIDEVRKYMDIVIEKRQRCKMMEQPESILDAYLDKIEKTSNPESAFFPAHGNITIAMQDVFAAGVDTTTSTLEWILFYLAKYPNVQEKIQNEIDRIFEKEALPSSQDRQKLPYVEAVIQEVLRMTSILPLSLLHSALEDTNFNGYCIPKGMMVVGNLYAVHHDSDIWGDPEIFRPERFLDEGGKFIKTDNVLAFSSGKRSCIAEHLARLQLFLYTVSIFKGFSVKPDGELPSDKGIFGLVSAVHPFQVDVSKRE